MKTELRYAIDRSISRNELVRVEVEEPLEALADIAADDLVTDFGSTETDDGTIDIWGYHRAEEFRLYIRKKTHPQRAGA